MTLKEMQIIRWFLNYLLCKTYFHKMKIARKVPHMINKNPIDVRDVKTYLVVRDRK